MNRKHRKTLARILERPTRADITWTEVESLLVACGAEIREGRGSRVAVIRGGQILRIHKPHPHKEMKKYAVEHVRDFLEFQGVTI